MHRCMPTDNASGWLFGGKYGVRKLILLGNSQGKAQGKVLGESLHCGSWGDNTNY